MAIMQINRDDVETDFDNAVEFSFNQTNAPKLMQMLGNYLYSDKEYAVISELCANAYDIHKQVGKESVPIRVDLPNLLCSEVVVRDYGTGLSESDVYKFLTSYGESSKGGTNDALGVFGIGSKSPAAVTDTWSIISYFDGMKTHYEVFVGPSGMSTISKLFSVPSSEIGLEVRVPTKSESRSVWTTAATKAFQFYKTRPLVNQNLHYPVQNFPVENDRYAIASGDSTNYYRRSKTYIVSMMRKYEISDKIFDDLPNNDLRKYLDRSLVLFFNVGEIDPSISREDLQYTKKTTDAILNRLQEVVDDISIMMQVNLNNPHNFVTVRRALQTVLSLYPFDKVMERLMPAWFSEQYSIKLLSNDLRWVSFKIPAAMLAKENIPVLVFRGKSIRVSSASRMVSNAGLRFDSRDTLSVLTEYITNIEFIVRDCKQSLARAKDYSVATGKTYILVDTAFVEGVTTRLASSLPVVKRGTTGIARNRNLFMLKGGKFQTLPKNFVFLSTQKYAVVQIKSIKDAAETRVCDNKFVTCAVRNGYTIIGYNKTKPDDMLSVAEVVKNLHHLYDTPEVHADLKAFKFGDIAIGFDNRTTKRMFQLSKFAGVSEKYRALWDGVLPYEQWCKRHNVELGTVPSRTKEAVHFSDVCEVLGLPLGLPNNTPVSVSSITDACIKNYPMLNLLYGAINKVSDAALNDYITLVDKGI